MISSCCFLNDNPFSNVSPGIYTKTFYPWGANCYNMPRLSWKTINGKKYLVLSWKRRINGKLKIIREVYIGDIDKLADIIQNPYRELDITTLDIKGKNSDSDRHIIVDIRDRDTVESAATGKDYVFHLAATTSPPSSKTFQE